MGDLGSFVNDCSLRDCPLLNIKFTWTNGQESPILCRLDGFLVLNDWEELYHRFSQEGLLKITSDHWPIMLNTSKIKYGPTRFQFENM